MDESEKLSVLEKMLREDEQRQLNYEYYVPPKETILLRTFIPKNKNNLEQIFDYNREYGMNTVISIASSQINKYTNIDYDIIFDYLEINKESVFGKHTLYLPYYKAVIFQIKHLYYTNLFNYLSKYNFNKEKEEFYSKYYKIWEKYNSIQTYFLNTLEVVLQNNMNSL